MRQTRVITFAVAWAALTVLAALAVWWGLHPLLSQDSALPSVPSPSVAPSASPSPSPRVTPSRPPPGVVATPSPQSSTYDGWAFADGTFTRTFETPGGAATVRIVSGQVSLVSQAARPGFLAKVDQAAPSRLVVTFYQVGGAQYIVDAQWFDGRPYAEVSP